MKVSRSLAAVVAASAVFAAGQTGVASFASAAPTAAARTNDGNYHAVSPARIADTRYGTGVAKARIGAGQTLNVPVAGRGGLPAAASISAVVVNITAVNTSAAGWLTSYPSGQARPNTSTVNFPAKYTGATTVSMPLGSNGALAIWNARGTTDLIVDVVGYYSTAAGTTGSLLQPGPDQRVYDSRAGDGAFATGDYVDIGGTFSENPATYGTPVALSCNITAANPSGAGWLTAWSGVGNAPTASTINYTKGVTIANSTIVPLRSNGSGDYSFRVLNPSPGATNIVVDCGGTFYTTPDGNGMQFVPMTPRRVVDTRSGTGISKGKIGPAQTRTMTLPASSVSPWTWSVALTATGANATVGTFLNQWDPSTTKPSSSILNVPAGINRSNGAISNPSFDANNVATLNVFNQYGSIDVIEDMSGRFDLTAAGQAMNAKSASSARAQLQNRMQRGVYGMTNLRSVTGNRG